MSNKKIMSILFLFLVILTSFRLIWISLSFSSTSMEAQQGVLDLSNWDFEEHEVIDLDGEWAFYPDVLLTPDDIGTNIKNYSWKPGKWNQDTDVYGTYRLHIKVPDEQLKRLYQIQLPHDPYVAKVIVNNEVVIDNASGDYNAATRKSGFFSRMASIKADANHEIEIIIQQPSHAMAQVKGIAKSIKFGNESALKRQQFTSVTMQILVATVTLLHFVFGLILFLWRRRYVECLYFGLAALFKTLAVVLDDDRLLLIWLPINEVWAAKMLAIGYIGTTVFILLFIQKLFSRNTSTEQKYNNVIYIMNISYVCLSVLIIVSPFQYISSVIPVIFIMAIFSYIVLAALTWKTIKRGDQDNVILLLGAAGTISSFLWPFYKESSLTEFSYYPLDALVVFLSISILLFRRFFQVSDHNKELAIKLQHEIKRKDDFLANTSHELRNPLHSIINIAQSVLQNRVDPLTQEKNIDMVVTIGRHMSRTLDDLLDITRLKEQKIQLHKENLTIHTAIAGVVDMLSFMAENKNIQLDVQIPHDFPEVMADKNRLIQIMFNLLHNAVKFSDDGIITIHADVRDRLAYIHIKDTGMGIDQETMKRIFDPYEQGDSSMTAVGGGLGLGLNISRKLVEMHGGTLQAESIVGEGSQFTFTLLLADKNHERLTNGTVENLIEVSSSDMNKIGLSANNLSFPHQFHSMYSLSKPRILAVDDDPMNLKVLATILSTEQYELETVTSGEAALARLHTKEWDLIIADVMMPHMSGYELTRNIREKYSISELPILLMTARSQSEDIYTGFLAGANDYVTKPADALELNVRVQALTNLKDSIGERLRMEAAWLQAQIQPHFLFNTLNTIISLSEVDTERMALLLDKFGYYLRQSFDSKSLEQVVSLKHERKLVDAYLYIEQERFGERLRVIWEVEGTDALSIPPLSIQTLIENAVRHGVLQRIEGGTIVIRVQPEEDYTRISIQDDGVGMDEDKVRQILALQPDRKRGIGLLNTDQRLKQMYGTGLSIDSTVNKGTTVSFKVPNNSEGLSV